MTISTQQAQVAGCQRTAWQVKVMLCDGAGKPAICNECAAKAYKRVTEYLEGTSGKSGHHR